MESILINELINLMCKCGCETFVGNFQRDASPPGPGSEWTKADIAEAIHYVKYMNEYFGKQEAIAVITSLVARFDITDQDISIRNSTGGAVGLEH